MDPVIIVVIVLVIAVIVALVIVGLVSPESKDPLQTRLAEFSARERPATLEEIELSQPFSERILLPIARKMGEFVTRFTPQASLQSIQHQLDLAGNPKGIDPTVFYIARLGAAGGLTAATFLLTFIAPSDSMFAFSSGPAKAMLMAVGAGVFGFFLPTLLLKSRITRRQDLITKAMPDALDLLTVCVEAGLGFDQAMSKVCEKWENELSMAFERVINEIRLGKLRREALRDMSDRMDVADMTSFVAAIIQADQLGVSIGKVLRIQSEQMRIKRRQRAEKKAHEAPVKMLIPMVFLIFPSIYIVLLGPSVIQIMKSGVLNVIR
jgi:tight adherence protein C